MKKYIVLLTVFASSFLFSQNYYHDTQGKLEISNSGSATYTLPIAMPPSIQDVGPVVNLVYNSGQMGGIAGQGWSINSISTISRIATRKDIDGFIDGVDFDDNDKLALDGQRLILKTGTYFASGSTYETETFSNTKIELQGSGSSLYFVVTTPDGSRSWYGNYGGTNAVDLTAFYIVRFEDANSNYMTYHYAKISNAIYIDEIRFSANAISSITPQNVIKFNYEDATRVESSYVKGVKLDKGRILKNVEVKTTNQLFRKYVLTHSTDTQLGYKKVIKIQESNGAGELANPIVFEYENTTTNIDGSQITSSYNNNLDFSEVNVSGDFDGDGRLDFVAGNKLYNNLFANQTGGNVITLPFTSHKRLNFPATTVKNNKLNQFQSIVQVYETATVLNFKVHDYANNSVANVYTKSIAFDNKCTNVPDIRCSNNPNTEFSIKNSNNYYEGDFNGDGISEVLIISTRNEKFVVDELPDYPSPEERGVTGPGRCTFKVTIEGWDYYLLDLNVNSSVNLNSEGYVKFSPLTLQQLKVFDTDKIFVMDFNGDGKSDIFTLGINKDYKVVGFKQLNQAPWVEMELLGQGTINDYVEGKQILFGDYNGDGKTDFMLPDSEGGSGHALWHLYYSNPNPAGGSFFVKESHHIAEYWPNTGLAFETQVHNSYYYSLDVNADGKSDFVRIWMKKYQVNEVFDPGNLDTRWMVTSYINNIGNTAVSGNKFQLDYSSPCIDLPIYGLTCDNPSQVQSFPIPIVSTYRNHGANKEVVMVRSSSNNVVYIDFTKDVSQDILLKKVTSSGGNIVDSIVYEELEPATPGTNGLGVLGEFYSSADAVNYPLVEVKRVPTAKLVIKLTNTTQGVTKYQDFRYHGFVVSMNGIGAMGFRKTARSAWYQSATAKRIWTVEENNPLWRSAIERSYNQLLSIGNSFSFVASGNPSGIISSTVNVFDYSVLSNKVFKISLASQTTSDYLSDFRTVKTYAYSEPYLLPEMVTTKNYFRFSKVAALQGTYTSQNEYENNPTGTGSSYYIGRPKKTITSSAAYMGSIEYMDEHYTYTGNRLTKTEKRPNDTGYFLTEEFEYFANGNLKKKTLSAPGSTPWTAARVTEYTYDPSERFVKTVKDVEGLVTTYTTYDPLYGVVLSESNPFAQTTTSVYDNWGKRTKMTDYLGKSVNYTYSKSGYSYTTHQVGDDGSESKIIADALGRTIKTGSKNINGAWSYINTEYDFMGRKKRTSEPYYDGGSPSQWNTIVYDDYSRVKQNIAYTGLTTNIAYSAGLLDAGAKVTVSDGTKTTSTTKNSNGHILSTTDAGGTITYTYYSNGNMKTSTFDGITLEMEYDLWGRKSKLVDPSAGTYTYQYYPFGEIYKETTPKGTTTYEYTSSGKVESKSVVGDQTYQIVFYSYNSNKQLVFMDGFDIENNFFTMQYDYDTNKRLKKTTETNPESVFIKELVYDDFGRVNKEYYKSVDITTGKSSAKWVRNTYLNGHHWQILDDATNTMLWQLDQVNERGQLVTAHYGNAVGRVSQRYDSYGMPLDINYRIINGTYASVVSFLTLTTDFNAQRGLLNLRSNSMFNIVENFQYDNQDRLTHFPDGLGQAEQQMYDNKGRITQNGNGAYVYGNSARPYQVTKLTLSPNASGYYTGRPLQQISYNAFKSPISIYEEGKERMDFIYNLFQTRTTMYYGGLQTDRNLRPLRKYYSADGVMEIKRNIQTGVVDFITYIGGDGYSAPVIIKSDGVAQNYYYLHRDYLGSIMAISNAAGQVVEKRHFDAWGNIVKLQNGSGTNLTDFVLLDRGYTGHEHLLGVGLINMNGRLYDPKVHRFLAPDNYIQDPTNTQNFNRYGYVLNNPLKYNDPSGEEAISFGAAVVIGAVISTFTYAISATLNDAPITNVGLLRSCVIGAFSAAVTFGIGSATQSVTQFGLKVTYQTLAHGAFQGAMSGWQGGGFWTGFASGSLSSLAASLYSGGATPNAKNSYWKGIGGSWGSSDFGIIAFGTVSGGAGAALTGGNFWQGAVTGLVVSGFNHAFHNNSNHQIEKELIERFKKGNVNPWGKPDLTFSGAMNLNKNVEGLEDTYIAGGKPNVRFEITDNSLEGLTNFEDVNLNPSKITNNLRFAALLFHEYRHAWQYASGNYYYWQKKYGYGFTENYMERDAYWFQIKMGAGSFFSGYDRYAFFSNLTNGITYKKR